MKVTIVTAYFAPEISPITHLYGDLAADLAESGAQVTVVTGIPSRGLSPQQRLAYQDRTDELAPEGYRILRIGGGTEGTNFIRRGFHLLFGAWALYKKAKKVPTDVYLLGSMPPFLGLIGAWLHKRAATVYVLQDIFPDSMLLMGKFSESHPITRLSRWMERKSYAGNTQLVTISSDMARTLETRGVATERICVIPNWVDATAVQPVAREDNPLFDELALPRDGFIALYAGTLGLLQCPDLLLDAAKLLKDRPDILFVILGGGGLFEHVKTRIADENLENVRLFPLQPPQRVSEVYSLGDVALIPLSAGVPGVAMPSKTWTAMAAARPLIITAEPGSGFADAVGDADCGQAIAPNDPAALAAAIEQAFAQRAALPEQGLRARAYVQERLSRKDATGRYYKLLTELTGGRA